MFFRFKEVYEDILRIEENINKSGASLRDNLFNFWIFKLLASVTQINDKDLLLGVSSFLSNSPSEKNFGELVALFNKQKKEHFEIVRDCIEQSGFECDFLDISNVKGGSSIIFLNLIEKISSSFKVIVILSADDIGKLNNSDEDFTFRPRLNVVLEMGLSYGILDMNNVLLLRDVTNSIDLISDIHGILRIDIKEGTEWEKKLTNKLEEFKVTWESEFRD